MPHLLHESATVQGVHPILRIELFVRVQSADRLLELAAVRSAVLRYWQSDAVAAISALVQSVGIL